jgi:hypothetical protein
MSRPDEGSYSSDSNPTSLQMPSSRTNSARAPGRERPTPLRRSRRLDQVMGSVIEWLNHSVTSQEPGMKTGESQRLSRRPGAGQLFLSPVYVLLGDTPGVPEDRVSVAFDHLIADLDFLAV